jgi:hypothetical protein
MSADITQATTFETINVFNEVLAASEHNISTKLNKKLQIKVAATINFLFT